jgi:hypothetical protein
LAALPVGANKTVFVLNSGKVFTNAPTAEVLPVPAYPLIKKTDLFGSLNKKVLSARNNLDCSKVG